MRKLVGSVVAALAVAVPVIALDAGPAAAGGSADWKQVSAGSDYTCGVTTGGRLFCWGDDTQQKLGNGAVISDQLTPSAVGTDSNWKQVSAGNLHTCAVKTTGQLYCWGDDTGGVLGDDEPQVDSNVPVEVAGGASNWVQVTVGEAHTCARKKSGMAYCWGRDAFGQLGEGGGDQEQHTPVPVNGSNWSQIHTSYYHSCGIKASGRLFCWGNNDENQLGTGTAIDESQSPVEVAGRATNWKQVETSGGPLPTDYTCARKTNGRLFCFGSDGQGEAGNGSAGPPATPDQVVGNARDWKSIGLGGGHACARKGNNELFCWGADFDGQLGNDEPEVARTSPAEVFGDLNVWKQVSGGSQHTCAIQTTGRLFCWGSGGSGRLGTGNDDQVNTPVEVATHP